MFKLIFAVLIFIMLSYLGFEYGERFKQRYLQLQEVLKGLTLLQNDVLYGMVPLPEAFEGVSERVSNPINTFLFSVSKDLYSGKSENIYNSIVTNYKMLENIFYLNTEDKKVMCDFFKSLGQSGIYGQEKIFSLAIENIKINLKYAKEVSTRNVKLYRYLGICIGAMIGIFML